MKHVLKRTQVCVLVFLLLFQMLCCQNMTVYASNQSSNYTLRKGIDVSHWQGTIDWAKVKASGVEFAIIKVGGRKNDGSLYTDSMFDTYMQGAINAGLKVGVYFWTEAVTEAEAREEAEYVVDKVYKYKITLPICLDYEWCPEESISSCRLYNSGQTTAQRTAVINAFINRVKQFQYAGALYANKSMLRNNIDVGAVQLFGRIWIANYSNPQWTFFGGATTDYEKAYDFFQFSSAGSVDGISGNVDMDYWYDDGTLDGIDYSTVFDPKFYADAYPDLKAKYGYDISALLAHFINYGMSEGRQGSSKFNVTSYVYQYPDVRNAFGNNIKQYYLHYISYGYAEGRSGTGCSRMVGATTVYNGVDYSAVYDYTDYINRYSDVFNAFHYDAAAVLQHFVLYGMKEGRQGKSSFNVNSYYLQYPDLRAAFGSDLTKYYTHYMTYGVKEGRAGTGCSQMQGAKTNYQGTDYSAVYDFNYYTSHNPDVVRAFGYNEDAVLQHFVNYGMAEGRRGNASFDVTSYRLIYADLRRAFGTNLKSYYLHYINYGKREGRQASGATSLCNGLTVYNGVDYSAVYNFNYYTVHNPDVFAAFGFDDYAVLQHFVLHGMSEGRQASASFSPVAYKNNYVDVRNAFGGNWSQYYLHYLNYGIREGRSGI